MLPKVFLCAFMVFFVAGGVSTAPDKVVCYVASWAYYRPGNGQFKPSHLDVNLCTHAVYTFVGLNEDATINFLDKYLAIDLGYFQQFNALRNQNPNLKTLLAIGGWNEGSVTYSNVCADEKLRAKFVKEITDFVVKYDFNGLDLDWEFPAQEGGLPYDKENFSLLVKELRAEFDSRGLGLILSAGVSATQASINTSYDVPTISQYLDFINLMSYELHGPWSPVTGVNAPLFPGPNDVTPLDKTLNVEACINAWINSGAPPEKVVMGLALFGHNFILSDPEFNEIGSPVSGPGPSGPITATKGTKGYMEICMDFEEGGWTKGWSDEQKVPYAYKGEEWIGYDDTTSLIHKVEYAKARGLGGVMVWSAETDDFRGICGPKFPLLNAVNSAMREGKNKQ